MSRSLASSGLQRRAFALVLPFALALAIVPAPPALGEDSCAFFFVPIVLSTSGANGSFYTSELTFTNRGTSPATLDLRYKAMIGSGSGAAGPPARASDVIAPGEQRVVPAAIAYLRGLGVPIPATGDVGGTLDVIVTGLTSREDAALTVRTTTPTASPLPEGAAGVAFPSPYRGDGVKTSGTVYGLREKAEDRSNLALHNSESGSVTVRVTVHSGDGSGASVVKAEALSVPGHGWLQLDRVLSGTGFTNGWATIERTATGSAFGAYGVVNCNGTNDGSFLPPISGEISGTRITVPVLVETLSGFESELVLANRSANPVTLTLAYVESLAPTPARGTVRVDLRPHEQLILSDALDFLRGEGIGVGPKGAASYAGALRVTVSGAPLAEVFAGARTGSRCAAGGQFGLFAPGVYEGQEATAEAFVYALRADGENRSNVALVHAGADGSGPVTLEVQAHDGAASGAPAGPPETVVLEPGAWAQLNGFLGLKGVKNGWVHVTRTAGTAPWIAYGVVNDGGAPGERTGDGAYVPMVATKHSPWTVETVPDTGQGEVVDGRLVYDSTGTPVIAHSVFNKTSLSTQVRAARWDRATSTWQTTAVDPTWYSAVALALAIDPSDGRPSVAVASNAIRLAHWTGSSWALELVEAVVPAVNSAVSLTYGPGGEPAITYSVRTPASQLRIARRKGSSWTAEAVEQGYTPMGSSLAFDRLGNPAIAYDWAIGQTARNTLKLARWSGTSWTTEVVETGVNLYGTTPSLAFDPSGNPSITHANGASVAPGGIRFVRWDGSRWVAEIVSVAGQNGSLAFDATGTPNVAFYVYSPASVHLARREADGTWTTEAVEGYLAVCGSPGLAFDPEGRPAVAYARALVPYGVPMNLAFAHRVGE